MSLPTPLWPVFMGFSAFLLLGGLYGRAEVARNAGAVILAAYIAMQIKKEMIDGLEAHAVSMAIWAAASLVIARLALIPREKYGISLTYGCIAFLLMLTGSCYLWARLIGELSGFGQYHSKVTDSLAVAAMLIASWGMPARVWSQFRRDIGILSQLFGLRGGH